jgi:hypothetical protein
VVRSEHKVEVLGVQKLGFSILEPVMRGATGILSRFIVDHAALRPTASKSSSRLETTPT